MDTQETIPLDSLIWAIILVGVVPIIVAVAAWKNSFEFRRNQGVLMFGLIGGVAAVLYFSIVVFVSGKFITTHMTMSETQKDFLVYLGSIAGMLLAAINATILHRRIAATEAGNDKDRYKAGIEHLANAQEDMKIAAYRELIQLAADTNNTKLCSDIFKILCDHIRKHTNNSQYQKDHKTKPSESIQTLLDLLFKPENELAFIEHEIDFRGVYLVGADLTFSILNFIDFKGADLRKVNLKHASLIRARFDKTQLQCANLDNAIMHNVSLSDAELQGASLRNTELQNARFYHVNLQGARLINAKLQCAKIHFSDFRGSMPIDIGMQEANIENGQFGGALKNYISDEPEVFEHTDSQNDFERIIRHQRGKEGDLSDCIFYGGLTSKNLAELTEEMFPYVVEKFRAKMQKHLDVQKKRKLTPKEIKDYEIDLSAYNEAEAEEMINEYNEAMKKISE